LRARVRARARTHAIEYRRWVDDLRARFRFAARVAIDARERSSFRKHGDASDRDYIIIARFGGKTARVAARDELSAEKRVSERAYIGFRRYVRPFRAARLSKRDPRGGLTWITPISVLLVTLT